MVAWSKSFFCLVQYHLLTFNCFWYAQPQIVLLNEPHQNRFNFPFFNKEQPDPFSTYLPTYNNKERNKWADQKQRKQKSPNVLFFTAVASISQRWEIIFGTHEFTWVLFCLFPPSWFSGERCVFPAHAPASIGQTVGFSPPRRHQQNELCVWEGVGWGLQMEFETITVSWCQIG